MSTTIEVSDLKQWRYCARIVWYRYCWPQIRPITDLMEHGIAQHQAEEGREERRSLRAYGLSEGERFFEVQLVSERLGIRGRLDLAIAVPARQAGAELVVVDYKDSEQAPGIHFKMQLAAYALLIEEAWSLPVRQGFIYLIPLRRAEPVKLSVALRRQTQEAIQTIQQSIDGERMPAAPDRRSICVSCEFRRFCNDVV